MEIPRFFPNFNIVVHNHSIDQLNVVDLLIPLFDEENFIFLTEHNETINDFFGGSLQAENFVTKITPNEHKKCIICDDILLWYKFRHSDVKWILLATWGVTGDLLRVMKEMNPTFYYLDLPTLDLIHSTYVNRIEKTYNLTYDEIIQEKKRKKSSGNPLDYLQSHTGLIKDNEKLRNLAQIIRSRPGRHMIYSRNMNREDIRAGLISRGIVEDVFQITNVGTSCMKGITELHMLDLNIIDFSLFMRGALNLAYGKTINVNYFVSRKETMIYDEFCSQCDELDHFYQEMKNGANIIRFNGEELKIFYPGTFGDMKMTNIMKQISEGSSSSSS